MNLVKDNVKKASDLYQIERTLITMLKDELKDLFRPLFNFDIIEDRYTNVSFANATIEARFPFYEIDRIELEEGGQTIFSRPFSFYNEGSISGIYSVLEDIFVTFYRFKKKAYQQKRLKIIYGNQITVARLLAVIRESVENTKDYDKYIQYLANPVQLHIAINRLYTLITSYQAQNDEGELLAYCLERDAATYNVSKRVDEKKPKYFEHSNLVYKSFDGRILALFEQELIDQDLLDFHSEANRGRGYLETIKAAITIIKLEQYLDAVYNIYRKCFTREVQNSTKRGPSEGEVQDLAFTTMYRMLQTIVDFLTIKSAIRKIDIGQLERIVDYLYIFFLGAGQQNYTNEMLYLRWLLKASTPTLKRTIIGTIVINISSKSGKGIASDKQLELYNSDYKKGFRQGNSTYDVYAAIQRRGLNREAYCQVRQTVINGFGREGTNYYTAKNVAINVVTLTEKMVASRYTEEQTTERASTIGLSEDLLIRSIYRLVPKLDVLNVANTERARNITNSLNDINIARVNRINGADTSLRTDLSQSIMFGVADLVIADYEFVNIDTIDDNSNPIVDISAGRDN